MQSRRFQTNRITAFTSYFGVLAICCTLACASTRSSDEPVESKQKRFLAFYYQEHGEPKYWKSEMVQIKEILDPFDVEYTSWKYGSNDWKIPFALDTFNVVHMQQFEPRNGYWIYEKGKEPLDIGYGDYYYITEEVIQYFKE